MRTNSIFGKFLLFLLIACVLTAALSVVFYTFSGAEVFARQIVDELQPRAYGIASLAERYLTGQLSFDSFVEFATKNQSGSRIYVFDNAGNLVAYTSDEETKKPSKSMCDFAGEILESGRTITSTDWRSELGVVVGVPIFDNMQRTCGAVLVSKPTNEVGSAMRNLVVALVLSCLIAALLMILPTYLFSRRMTAPIQRMTEASIAMAGGDFSVQADERRTDEIGQLGRALNHLSARLDTNIRDLVLARNRLHTILEGLEEGVASIGSDGAILYCNPSALQLFHCPDAAALAEEFGEVRALCDEMAADPDHRTRTLRLNRAEQALLCTLTYSQETTDLAAGMVLVVQDVTAAERLEQTRRDYVANVSHELRTPISSIRSLAETLNDGLVKSEDDRSRYYGYILRESVRLSRLINDLLELSRLQSGSVALEKNVFDLRELMYEVAERTRITASYSGIDVQLVSADQSALPVCSNRDRVEQVMIALLDNAIKFASDEGSILIEAAERGGRALVSIKNTGHIDEKDLPHLFERFYKADASHSDGGTGLGLAIVQEILARLGESVEADNEDGFAVFRFTVSLAENEKR